MNSIHSRLITAAFALLGAGNEPLQLRRKEALHQRFDFRRLLQQESGFGKDGKAFRSQVRATYGRNLKSNPTMNHYTLHNEAGTRWILDERGNVAAHLRSTVTAKQAEAILVALEDNREESPARSRFLEAIQHGKATK